jgi:hypothetical protein
MINIETGVDKLVGLIKECKKITVADAAKKLGVSKTVLQEWADFLQEEKVIDIDYKFTSTWLIEKKMTEEDIKNKKSEFESLKDNFIRKVETSIESVNHETLGLEKIRSEFDVIKKEISFELEKVQAEVKELESYENLKRNIDQEIINQQAEFRNAIRRAHEDLLLEDKKYQNLVMTIKSEEQEVKNEESAMDFLYKKEEALKKNLSQIALIVEDTHKKIDDSSLKINYAKEHIESLEKSAAKIEELISQKRKALDPLLIKSQEQEENIILGQKKLLQKVMENKSKIGMARDEGKQTIDNFKAFFEKKAQVEMLLIKIEEDKIRLKAELSNLIKKAKMFDIMSASKSSEKNVAELKILMGNVEGKKELFKQEIAKLMDFIKK